jgi:hypothetical protein
MNIAHTLAPGLNYHPSPGTAQTSPNLQIIGDQKSPMFFPYHRLAQI